MTEISSATALLGAMAAAALILVILTVRSVEWLARSARSSREARLVSAQRLRESWATPLALAPILEGRRVARERDDRLTR